MSKPVSCFLQFLVLFKEQQTNKETQFRWHFIAPPPQESSVKFPFHNKQQVYVPSSPVKCQGCAAKGLWLLSEYKQLSEATLDAFVFTQCNEVEWGENIRVNLMLTQLIRHRPLSKLVNPPLSPRPALPRTSPHRTAHQQCELFVFQIYCAYMIGDPERAREIGLLAPRTILSTFDILSTIARQLMRQYRPTYQLLTLAKHFPEF